MPGIVIRGVEYRGEVTDLLVNGRAISPISSNTLPDSEEIQGRGLIAVPGFVDVHVHFRDPGLTEKEDLLTGARAAAAGGFTTVLCEPNTRPVIDTAERVSAFYGHTEALGIPIAVLTKAAVTLGEAGETLTDIPALATAHAAALSDDGEPLVRQDLLIEAFRASAGLVLTAHCEETPRSADKVRAALGDGTAMGREVELIRLHIEALALAGGGRLHIQHVSLAESAVLIADAKRRGLAVTAEVTPHHLLLCADDIPHQDANWKMNPPLRSRADMQAVRRALADGVIDMIATDHAPHTMVEKAQGWENAPFGIIGLEAAFGACMRLVHDGTLTLDRLVAAMSKNPIALLPDWARTKAAGGLTLIDPSAEWTVDPDQFYSKARNCPFAGMAFQGKPVYTIADGKVVMAERAVRF